ncbi:unnamed protein product [Sympodiomycopsis kandeliae]
MTTPNQSPARIRYERDVLSSSPTSALPRMVESSREAVEGLLDQYHKIAELWRLGGSGLQNGPYFLGTTTDAECNKFEVQTDRRLPIMVLPTADDKVHVFLCGDPLMAHAKLGLWIAKKVCQLDLDGLAPTNDFRELLRSFGRSFDINADGKLTTRVWEHGELKHKNFAPGTARKEPDVIFTTSDDDSLEDQRALSVIEVAYMNENLPGFIFEAKLWSEFPATVPHNPLNFFGVKISEKTSTKQKAELPAAFFFLTITSSKEVSASVLNASETWIEECRAAMEQAGLGQPTINVANEVAVPLTGFLPTVSTNQNLNGAKLVLTIDDLSRKMWQARRQEDQRHLSIDA